MRSLAAMYLMAALVGAPYVRNRPLHRFSLAIFQLIGTPLYRLFLIGTVFGHLSIAFWEPPALRSVDKSMDTSALCVGIELCFCSVYILHFYTRLSIEASRRNDMSWKERLPERRGSHCHMRGRASSLDRGGARRVKEGTAP